MAIAKFDVVVESTGVSAGSDVSAGAAKCDAPPTRGRVFAASVLTDRGVDAVARPIGSSKSPIALGDLQLRVADKSQVGWIFADDDGFVQLHVVEEAFERVGLEWGSEFAAEAVRINEEIRRGCELPDGEHFGRILKVPLGVKADEALALAVHYKSKGRIHLQWRGEALKRVSK